MLTPEQRRRILIDHLRKHEPTFPEFGEWCGCAVGYACTIPELNDDGLWIDIEPHFAGYRSWGAVDAFFGLTREQSTTVFLGRTPTAREVADRLDQVGEYHPLPQAAE